MASRGARRFIVAAGGLAIVCGSLSGAFALDAFWQGRRGPVWEHGINPIGGKSNWYSRPRRGRAREVPDEAATFTGKAQEFDVWITEDTKIGTIVIRADALQYDFVIKRGARFSITGSGILNDSPHPARFFIRDQTSLNLLSAAELISSHRSAVIRVAPLGQLQLRARTDGGNAVVESRGTVHFNNTATAGRMIIENGDPFGHDHSGKLGFLDRSTPGRARIVNLRNGILSFATTRGPGGDGKITAGDIENRYQMYLGSNTLTIKENFVQDSEGTLDVKISNGKCGNMIVKGAAQLNGNLIVHADGGNVAPGSYRVLLAEGGRTGGFVFQSNISKSRLAYSSKEVYLIVDP